VSHDTPIEIIARAVILRGGKVLLCGPKDGDYLYLPGGHVEAGERASDAAARELREELGAEVRVGSLMLVHEHSFTDGKGRRHHEVNLVFHVEQATLEGEDIPDEPEAREPDLRFVWVDLAALPETDLLPRAMGAWLLTGGSTGEAPTAGHLVDME